jgi:hypothetical protein
MINLALVLLFASPPEQPTLPRQPDSAPVEQQQNETNPADPWFDKPHVATDDPAFLLAALENARQGVVDSTSAAHDLGSAELRAAAEKIQAQNTTTSQQLEKLAGAKGWRLPQANPSRASTTREAGATSSGAVRTNANFIVSQIANHQNTLAQYRAQIAGKGDADLKRVLRQAVPGYQKNLEMLLTLKP